MATVINVCGQSYSGTTMLDLMLGNARDVFSCGAELAGYIEKVGERVEVIRCLAGEVEDMETANFATAAGGEETAEGGGETVKAAVGATFNTGERLYSWCMSAEKSERDLCSAYIAAVADVLAYGPVGTYRACLPRQEVEFSKVHEAAAKWLESHPEDRHFSAVGLVARALSESFPCQ